jgi:hypothetical protein
MMQISDSNSFFCFSLSRMILMATSPPDATSVALKTVPTALRVNKLECEVKETETETEIDTDTKI